MSELELVELLDNSKKDASNENSSMLKGIVILEALTALRQPASLAHLMQITGMPKASLHRTLAIFEEAGLVMREPGGKAYTPGDRLANLALDQRRLQHAVRVGLKIIAVDWRSRRERQSVVSRSRVRRPQFDGIGRRVGKNKLALRRRRNANRNITWECRIGCEDERAAARFVCDRSRKIGAGWRSEERRNARA